jgi:hypothetical protein
MFLPTFVLLYLDEEETEEVLHTFVFIFYYMYVCNNDLIMIYNDNNNVYF